MNILDSIIENKRKEIAERKRKCPIEALSKTVRKSTRSLKDALQTHEKSKINLIAEIKKASPSEGVLRPHLENELPDIVALYNRYASAISVVTDEKFFQGMLEWIKKIRTLTHLPILCKDFIIDEYQIYEARAYRADAILLIAAALDEAKLKNYIKTARMLGMDSLVEAHSQDEIHTALNAGANIIGINNRDLSTFAVNIETTVRLAHSIPPDIVTVSESGFSSKGAVQRVADLVDAVLIGTIFMKTPADIGKTITELGF